MPVAGSSPSTSSTTNESPKSVKTEAKTPRVSARMNEIGELPPPSSLLERHASSRRTASAVAASVSTSTSQSSSSRTCSGVRGPSVASAETWTATLSSASLERQASALFLPTSAGER